MCCLFGIMDGRHALTVCQKNQLMMALAAACEARGTDATGIAYNSRGRLKILKHPVAGHKMHFCLPKDAPVIMGHCRMTTQGSARRNYNNHPFLGCTAEGAFALAHNGVLYNDTMLRRVEHLPKTKIETDSYIAVQLIEQKKTLSFASLRNMAEQVEGSFTFTVLDEENALWVVKGDNPLCIYHFPHLGLWVYASTEELLKKALHRVRFLDTNFRKITVESGELMKIALDGTITRSQFDDSGLFMTYGAYRKSAAISDAEEESYIDALRSIAGMFGYLPEAVDRLIRVGFSPEEVEELLYEGEM